MASSISAKKKSQSTEDKFEERRSKVDLGKFKVGHVLYKRWIKDISKK